MPVDDAPASEVLADFKMIVHPALRRGLSIHPVKPRGKEPWLNNWPKQATTDLNVIAEWMKRFPTSNYGVAASDQYCILESDNFSELQSQVSRQLPRTYIVQARPNRPHIYFRQTEASKAAGNLDSPGVFEFKQNNRYVIGEGSIHPTGSLYTCIQNEEIAPIPDWLVDDLKRLHSGSGLRVSGPPFVSGEIYGEGERHQRLMTAAARMWDGLLDEEDFVQAIHTLNLKHCDPPKTEAHVRSIVRWVMERDPAGKSGLVMFEPLELSGEKRQGTAFDFVLGPTEGQTEGAFALGTVHLFSGSSGAGKTTFGIQMLQDQKAGISFFGRQTYSRPFLIVMQDRSEFELERTFRRMGIDKGAFPFVALTSAQSVEDPAKVLKELYNAQAVKPEILFVEGLDMWTPDAIDMKKVVPVLAKLQDLARHYHLALIGTVGAPKAKPKERYASPRDRAFGSAAWARRADTVLDITVDEDTQDRHIWLLLRNAPPQKYEMQFEGGRLVLKEPSIITGPDLSPQEIAEKHKVSLSTAYEWKKKGRIPK